LVTYTFGEIPDRFAAFLQTRKPGVDPASLVATGTSGIRTILGRFLDVGFSKFVLAPIAPLPDTRAELEMLAAEVLSLQN
jgi:hypothetical protein